MQNPDIDSDNFPTVIEEDGLLVLSAIDPPPRHRQGFDAAQPQNSGGPARGPQDVSHWQKTIDDDRQERMVKTLGGSLASEA